MVVAKKSSKKVVSKSSSKKSSVKKFSPKKTISESIDPYTDYDPYKSESYGNADKLSQNLKDLDTTGLTTKQKVVIGTLLAGGTLGTGVYAYNKLAKKPVVAKPAVKTGFFARLSAPAKPKPLVKPSLFSGLTKAKPVSKPGFFDGIFSPKPAPKKTLKSLFTKKPVPKKFLGIF